MIFLGDFDVTDDKHHIDNIHAKKIQVIQQHHIGNLHATKIPVIQCIDLNLTNVPGSFQSTCVIETGLPDFHLMNLNVMRKSFKK